MTGFIFKDDYPFPVFFSFLIALTRDLDATTGVETETTLAEVTEGIGSTH